MTPLLRSLRRIFVALGIGLLALWLALFWTLRQPSWGRGKRRDAPQASAERLERDVRRLAEDISHRDVDHPEGLEEAALYVEAEMRATGARVERQEYEVEGRTHRNLIARWGDGEAPRIVVGAHYDACGLFGDNPGADDNASGTAGVLELTRLLAGRPLGRVVELVAFDTEEPPHFASPQMGSVVHARSLVGAGVPVWGMVNLEMIGYFTERQPWPSWLYASLYPHRGDFAAIVGRYEDRAIVGFVKKAFRGGSDLPIYSFTPPIEVPGIDASDHRSYWREGVPAVMVTDTAIFRNENYHSPDDTADTLDYRRMAGVVDGVLSAILAVAE